MLNLSPELIGQSLLFQQSLIHIHNDSGEAMPAGGVGRVTGVTAYGGKYYLSIAKPDTTFARWYIVNALVPIPDDGFGVGYFGPMVSVRYDNNTGTPAAGQSWGAKSGQWTLVKDRPGFTVWDVAELGPDYTMIATQEPVNVLTGIADGAISIDSTGTVSVHFAASGTASEYNVTGHLKWMHNSEGISSGKELLLKWVDGQWLIVGAECEV